jgi:hypothetical protein
MGGLSGRKNEPQRRRGHGDSLGKREKNGQPDVIFP